MFTTELWKGRKILVAITGGIAAYKACEFIRWLMEQGAEVRVMMTAAAQEFITPLTLESLTRHPVYRELFPKETFSATQHINLADWADAVAVVPATANIIGKMAQGIADDLVSSTLLAAHTPVMVAPAMNTHMWENPAVQRNVRQLEQWGVVICPPEYGYLAEGYSGMGRLARLEYLIQAFYRACHPDRDSLKGKRVLITAGRTEEPLDPVRILTNRSTGKMGFALAWEAYARGAEVTLIHGPTQLCPPFQVESIAVQTAQEMFNQVQKHFSGCHYFLSAAAVADYRPAQVAKSKIKKGEGAWTLQLESTPDILHQMGQNRQVHQILVGFAVETENEEANAREKLKQKNLDLIVVNNPREEGAGFAVDTNRVMLIHRNGQKRALPQQSKLDVARNIFSFLLQQKS